MLQVKSETRYTLYIAAWAITAVMGVAGVTTYYASNPGIIGMLTAILLFLGYMLVMKAASAILFDSSMPGIIRFFALLAVMAVVLIDVFAFSHEKQTGVMAKIESAANVDSTTASSNERIRALQTQLAACPANHYTKCKAPLIEAIQQAQNSSGTVTFSADNAGERSYWESMANWYNEDRLPEDHLTAGDMALYVFAAMGLVGSLFAVFAFGIYGASENKITVHSSPTPPTLPTGTDDQSGYKNTRVGFNTTAPTALPAATSHQRQPRATQVETYRTRLERQGVTVPTTDKVMDQPIRNSVSPTPITAQTRAQQRWGVIGNLATVQEIPTSTVPAQLNTVQNSSEQLSIAEKYSKYYPLYAKAVTERTVKPTIRPSMDYIRALMKEQGETETNGELKTNVLPDFFQRLQNDCIIKRVEGRTTSHPQGLFEVIV